MKKTGIVLSCMVSFFLSAQTHDLVKHNGERVLINYIKTDTNLIYFSNPNSSEEGKISTYAVQSLTEKSTGKIQVVSSKLEANKEVIFLKNYEINGLKKVAPISIFLGRPKGMSFNDLSVLKKTRLQEKAVQKGAVFIVITSETFDTTQADLYSY